MGLALGDSSRFEEVVYSTCLFCNGSLGQNEALEHFPVGRRLAYDTAKGRLWVVCAQCERWNLSPLDTRWEAIDEAERLFRATRLRASTDNIGMAQLNEGLQLVRLGAPPKLELAGWRYGDQFGRRRRRHLLLGTAAIAGGGALLSVSTVGVWLGMAASLGTAANLTLQLASWLKTRGDTKVIRASIRDNDGEVLPLTRSEIRGIALVADASDGGWFLKVRQNERKGARTQYQRNRDARARSWLPPSKALTGDAALRALSALLPQVNSAGGSAGEVREAVKQLDGASSLDTLLRDSATRRLHTNSIPGENLVAGLPPRVRLALEMVLHENDERRALEGEMAALEARWREAEEIAGIADGLLEPADLDGRLSALRSRAGAPSTE